MKICSKCNIEKSLNFFEKRSVNSYRGSCKDCIKIYMKLYCDKNHEKIVKQRKEVYQNNREQILEKNSNIRKIRLKNDVGYKLTYILRSRVKNAIKKNYGNKAYKTIDLTGCSIEQLKQHLESKFQSGMSWDNYGLYGWHIDHIRPCASFNLTNPEQQKLCFHYTNLQPLWAKDNLSKNDKWSELCA